MIVGIARASMAKPTIKGMVNRISNDIEYVNVDAEQDPKKSLRLREVLRYKRAVEEDKSMHLYSQIPPADFACFSLRILLRRK